MEKNRFLEGAAKWFYNLLFNDSYTIDNYWEGIVFLVIAVIVILLIVGLAYSIIYDWMDRRSFQRIYRK